MKKLIYTLVTTSLLFTMFEVSAQEYNNVKGFEFEMGMGLNHGNIRGYSQSGIGLGLTMFIEARFNLKESPLDIGVQSSIGDSYAKKVKKGSSLYDINTFYMAKTIYLDYNYRKWKNISLFGGLGLGCSVFGIDEDQINHDGTVIYGHGCPNFHYLFVFSPRVGAEFFNHIRLTFDRKIMSKHSSYYTVNVGIVLGGGIKK